MQPTKFAKFGMYNSPTDDDDLLLSQQTQPDYVVGWRSPAVSPRNCQHSVDITEVIRKHCQAQKVTCFASLFFMDLDCPFSFGCFIMLIPM